MKAGGDVADERGFIVSPNRRIEGAGTLDSNMP